jgi:orotate phosphoribosyltransferase-like protein
MPKVIDHKSIQKKAQKLRKTGFTLKDIAVKLDISYPTLRKVFTDDSHRRDAQKLKNKIIKYHLKGLSYSEISRMTNCSRQYAHKVVTLGNVAPLRRRRISSV